MRVGLKSMDTSGYEYIQGIFNQIFQYKTGYLTDERGRAGMGEGAVGRASTIGFRSITPKPFEIFE